MIIGRQYRRHRGPFVIIVGAPRYFLPPTMDWINLRQ
jgi:hypothetical protein